MGLKELVLVARRGERLEQLRSEIEAQTDGRVSVSVQVRDLSRAEERSHFVDWINQSGLSIELLINNAGFGTVGEFLGEESESQTRMVELNCIAPLELSRALLPGMVRRGKGAILNVASTAAFQPLPYMATYAATKSFLISVSLALANEVRRHGVKVLCLCPGPTRTEFHLAAGLPEKIDNLPAASASEVVREALAALDGRRDLVITGLINRALAGLAGVLPFRISVALGELTLRRYAKAKRERDR
jgi:hypothetical protein